MRFSIQILIADRQIQLSFLNFQNNQALWNGSSQVDTVKLYIINLNIHRNVKKTRNNQKRKTSTPKISNYNHQKI